MLLHLHPKTQSTHIPLPSILLLNPTPSPPPTLFPHSSPCFPLYPIPQILPLSHPFSPQISLPTLIFHTQITPSPLSIPPYPIILPLFTSNSTPGFAPNHPKTVKTIPTHPSQQKQSLTLALKSCIIYV